MIDQALGWVGDLVRALREGLLPSMEVVLCTQAGVRYRRGKEPSLLDPGLYLYWAPFTDINTHDTVQQPGQVEEQHLISSDGVTLSVGMAYRYRIVCPLTWDRDHVDPEESLEDAAQAAVRRLVVRSPMERLRDHRSRLDDALLAQIKKETADLGVEILAARFTSLAPARVLALLGVN